MTRLMGSGFLRTRDREVRWALQAGSQPLPFWVPGGRRAAAVESHRSPTGLRATGRQGAVRGRGQGEGQ